jgi:rhamnogalacturonan acetylesterase
MKNFKFPILALVILLLAGAWTLVNTRPTIYLIGDSTVKNGQGKGDGGLWGWGKFLPDFFDSSRVVVENDARGGTSSRTFQNTLWDAVLAKLKPGDFVIMQFGHNDNGALADSARARGTIKGIGLESKEIYNPILKKQEVVHTYGWYMRKFISDTRSKGATPVVCSPVPRNDWKDGKIIRDTSSYAKWAAEVAKAENVSFISLNEIICNHSDQLGEQKARYTFFGSDHTHTIEAGAKFNASCVVEGIKALKDCPLQGYLLQTAGK